MSHARTHTRSPLRLRLASDGRPLHVLLVEDDSDAAALAARRLECSPLARFAVTRASTLAQALHYMEQLHYDVVLLDIGLPDSHDVNTLGTASLLAPYVPILVLSANQDPSLVGRARTCGICDYLLKGLQDGGTLPGSVLRASRTRAAAA